jgi:hypothetical protein
MLSVDVPRYNTNFTTKSRVNGTCKLTPWRRAKTDPPDMV